MPAVEVDADVTSKKRATEIRTVGIWYAMIFGALFSAKLAISHELTLLRLLIVAVLSLVGGLLFGYLFWLIYGRKHQ